MGFGALAAWVLIWLSSRTGRNELGLAAGLLILIPALFALAAPSHEISVGTLGATMRRVWSECKSTFFRWEAVPYTACMVFPIASGAAVSLLPGVARQFGVNGRSEEHTSELQSLR